MHIVRSLIIAAGALAIVGTASAQDVWHNFQVKVGVSSIQPAEKSTISAIGGEVNISNEYVRRFRSNISSPTTFPPSFCAGSRRMT